MKQKNDIKKTIETLKPTIFEVFQYLHANPEPSWKEIETTRFLKTFLESNGFVVQTFADCTGLVIEVGNGEFCVGLRADIDALWQEVNGSFCANHSCGHDAHMAMVVGTMLLLKELHIRPNGKLKFIFQPAEEKATGALKLIEKGIIDDIDFLYGVHLRPLDELKDGEASPAISHGSVTFINGFIKGEDAHGARPHLGQNAIEVGATLVNELNKIHLNPMTSYSIKMTNFHAGSDTGNLIPGKATFSLDLRAQTNETMEDLTKRMVQIVEATAALHNVDITLSTASHVAAAMIDNDAKGFMERAIIDSLGVEKIVGPILTSGSDDFHFYTLKRPNIKATMLALGCHLLPGLHHPQMTFNHKAIFSGIEILVRTILHTFDGNRK